MICRTQVETSIGELLGSYYLKEVWTDKTAAEANLLVLKLKAAFMTGLESAEWLDDATRANAQDKLSKLTHLVGGPKNPKTYPTLTFDPKAYIANLNKVSAFDTTFNLALIDTAVDKHLWNKLAQSMNAVYQPSKNRIVFTAAFLQPPFFDAKADPYDGNGKKKPWWTETTAKIFREKAECFVDQYRSMDVKSELTGDLLGKLDGRRTRGETIADNGGLNTVYRAYRDFVNAEVEATKYTKEAGEKMFWIRYAQSWCEKNSDARLQFLLTDAYIANLNKVSAFDTTFNLALIDTAVDKHLWNKLAQSMNAVYQPSKNRIVIPAAYLQPPFFDAKADPRYDGNGKKKPWWTETAAKIFREKAECFVDQYRSMDVKSELTGDLLGKLDGRRTRGETIADNGGLNTVYRAYRDFVNAEVEATKYTKEAGEKMFWIRYAQSWCEKNSDARLQFLLTDVHPPNRHRLIGSVQNSVDFAKAFNCPVDSPMNPTKKCVMW
ncbi:hypothetical protein H257_12056 [Aphanomyces astaci]|uniref:Peptidase M13 C-terminal domain-containing protein n=1 Tax=Aphanomyces astaci TaxID=112090 RepID=W4G258_APHAT|nr:hypothetical protein H257_12056 [Aphanomyces astaci]ETV73018.1 hypothetical protein H257_12056 [Aphanomyces astaci]|eukprot:XP_009837467.1 hypothetical protein H257_12056 [Aphanomyces astaci]